MLVVGRSDVSSLARADKFVNPSERFIELNVRVVVTVCVVEVDVVGLQPAKRVLGRLPDRLCTKVALAGHPAALGRHDHLVTVAPGSQPAPDDLLRLASG